MDNIFGFRDTVLGHCFVLSENCCSQKRVKKRVKKKSGFLSISPPILVLQTKFEYFWNPCEISDQMSPSEAPNSKKNPERAQNFFIKSSKNWIKRAPQSRVNCRFRRHLLSEMHNFRAIWLVSSRLLEHCQFSHIPGRIGLWRLFPFILPYIFLPYNFRTYF